MSDAHGVCGDTRRIIAEFPLTQSSHFSQLSRRCRIFAALVGLGSKHRLGLSRATAEAAKVFHDASVSAFVRFALRAHNENDIAEVQVVASVPEVTRIVTSELLTSERLSKIQDLAATLVMRNH
ncbi:MAG: hypothetical protein R3C56_39285 [Pirellulaceae bacterium]